MSSMPIEDQKFMALEGVQVWARALVNLALELNRPRYATADRDQLDAERRELQACRHFFLIAARQLLENAEWAKELGFLDQSAFAEIDRFSGDIRSLRNLNEHVVEYFRGIGRRPENWVHETEQSIDDASTTNGTRIGGRLDWNEVASATRRLLDRLPSQYFPINYNISS